jgi:hypothetical protein
MLLKANSTDIPWTPINDPSGPGALGVRMGLISVLIFCQKGKYEEHSLTFPFSFPINVLAVLMVTT